MAPAVLGLVATGGGALGALRGSWYTATVSVPQLPEVDVAVSGNDLVPGATGLAVLVMACAVGVLAAGPRLRRVIGIAATVAAVAGTWLVLTADPDVAMARALADAAVAGADPDWSAGVGRALAAIALSLAACVGAAVAVLGPRWSTMGSRYDAPSGRQRDEADLWKALDDGIDPTA